MTTFTDLTGRHSIAVVGTSPTLVFSGGPGGGSYAQFAGNGCLEITGNAADWLNASEGPYCIELIAYVFGPNWDLNDYTSGSTIDRILDTFDGYFGILTGLALSGNRGQQSIAGVTPPWSSAAYGDQWIKLRYDIRPGRRLDIYINDTLVVNDAGAGTLVNSLGTLRIAGQIDFDGYYTKTKLAGVRITRANRGSEPFNLNISGASDPHWADTLLLVRFSEEDPTQTVTFSSRTDTTSWTTDSGASGKTVSGTLSAALTGSQVLRVSFNNGSTWSNATVTGTSWTVTDPLTHTASWVMKAQVINGGGALGPLATQSVALLVWPTLTIDSMSQDSDTVGDWITYSGVAGRTVSGTLSAAAPAGSVVELSSDGTSWTTGSITGLSWSATDPLSHSLDWTYQVRLRSDVGIVSPSVSQPVVLTAPPANFSPQGTFSKCLDLIRRFCQRTGLPQPTYVIGNPDAQISQLLGLLEESLEALVRRPERGWQTLTREALFVTKAEEVQGSLSDLAPGLVWITDDTLFNRTTRLPIYGPLTPEERQVSKALQVAGPYYRFWVTNDQLHMFPVPPAGHLIAFEYVSTYAWASESSPRTYRDAPAEETDVCVIPRDIVLADLRWRWREAKGLEYAQAFQDFEMLLARALSNDGGRKSVSMEGSPQIVRPGILVPAGNWKLS